MKVSTAWKIGISAALAIAFAAGAYFSQAPREKCTSARQHLYIDNGKDVLVRSMADLDNMLFDKAFKNDYPIDLDELVQQIEFDAYTENVDEFGFSLLYVVTWHGVTFYPIIHYDGTCRYTLGVSHHIRELWDRGGD